MADLVPIVLIGLAVATAAVWTAVLALWGVVPALINRWRTS